jgi:hypothetical protein
VPYNAKETPNTISPTKVLRNVMALSDYEKRVLHELEYSLFAQDPQFDENLSGRQIRARRHRAVRWSVVAFVLGTGVLVGSFTSSPIVSIFSLVTMFVSSVVLLSNASALYRLRKSPTDKEAVLIN